MTKLPDDPKPDGKLYPSVPGKVFGGQWLRRERERVAIGRAKIAARLGISPYNLRKLELMNWTIPAEWIAPLAELGFRVADKDDAAAVPDTVASQAEQSAATVASALVPTPIVDAASSAGDQLTPGFDGGVVPESAAAIAAERHRPCSASALQRDGDSLAGAA